MAALPLLHALADTYAGIHALYPVTAPYPVELHGAALAAELRWLASATPPETPATALLLGWHVGLVQRAPGSPRIPLVVRAETCAAFHGTARARVSALDRTADEQGFLAWLRSPASLPLGPAALWQRWAAAAEQRAAQHERLARAFTGSPAGADEAREVARLRGLAAHLRRELAAMESGLTR